MHWLTVILRLCSFINLNGSLKLFLRQHDQHRSAPPAERLAKAHINNTLSVCNHIYWATPRHQQHSAARMKVVSLLPSATELVCLVGGTDMLVGRSHE
jgi:hypothetical protein